jgi:5-methylcytosine-specific restriction protein A
MQNISYVLDLSGREWLKGLKPASHVGPNVIAQIEEILSEIEARASITICCKEPVILLLSVKELVPNLVVTNDLLRKSFKRQALSVIACSCLGPQKCDGICELCNQEAPFQTIGGLPFLEVLIT